MKPATGAVIASVLVVAAGCTSSTRTVTQETALPSSPDAPAARGTTAPPIPPLPQTTLNRRSVDISRETWTEGPWPLTVNEAVLKCQGDNLVTIATGEEEYALNAAAYELTELPDAAAISIPDPNNPGFHLDVGPLIQRGLTLCAAAPATISSTPTGSPNRLRGYVDRETWPGRWPFTVDSATLLCQGGAAGKRVTVVAGGEMYALNGTAKDANLWPPFDVIWLDDPKFPGSKIYIGQMIDYGLALCD